MSVKGPGGPPRAAPEQTQRRASVSEEPAASSPTQASSLVQRAVVSDHFEVPREAPPPAPLEAPPPPDDVRRGALTPTEPRTYPTTLHVNGVDVVTHGAVSSAILESVRVTQLLTQRPDVAAALARRELSVVIIPSDRRLTELPEFAHLSGQRTFDGRRWDDVRGVGGTYAPDGKLYVGVPEENLARLPSDPYSGGFNVALHELAHVIHDHAVSADERGLISAAYAGRRAEGGPWTDNYATINEREYFAQGANAYFDCHAVEGRDAAWLYHNDAALYALLVATFPRRETPATTGEAAPAAGGVLDLLRNNSGGPVR